MNINYAKRNKRSKLAYYLFNCHPGGAEFLIDKKTFSFLCQRVSPV